MDDKNISNNEKLNKVELKNHFDNLKSNIILKKIFDIMKKNKSLDIMKYNKILQKRLKLTINDYKKYSQFYTPIEIELKLENNKFNRFIINLHNEDAKYYHIYFDNSKDEIKRNYLYGGEKFCTILIIIDYQIKSFHKLFYDCNYITSICFKKFHRINITDMSFMFSHCSSLKELNLSKFNTNNVTNMNDMFSYCSSLKELNLSNFNTNNVISMCSMFSYCTSLKELNLSNFNTNNVINMRCMFFRCSSLKELNLSNFNIYSVNDMNFMFSYCTSLKEINLSNFNDFKGNDINDIFDGCSDELIKKIKKQN